MITEREKFGTIQGMNRGGASTTNDRRPEFLSSKIPFRSSKRRETVKWSEKSGTFYNFPGLMAAVSRLAKAFDTNVQTVTNREIMYRTIVCSDLSVGEVRHTVMLWRLVSVESGLLHWLNLCCLCHNLFLCTRGPHP